MAASPTPFPIGVYCVLDGDLTKQKGCYHMNLSIPNPALKRVTVLLLILAIICSLLGTLRVTAGASSHKANGALGVFSRLHHLFPGQTPPSDATCRVMFMSPCYSPQEIRRAYGLSDLINDGFTG